MRDLRELADRTASVPGVIIECGSAHCGSAIYLAKHLKKRGRARQLFALDSYAGFRRDELARERANGGGNIHASAFADASFEYVVAKLRKLKLTDRIRPVQGFFQDTLAPLVAEAGQVAMAFIDCNLEESTAFCAETVWSRIPSGGIVVFDDYADPAWAGVARAVDAFFLEHQYEIADHGIMRRMYYVKKR